MKNRGDGALSAEAKVTSLAQAFEDAEFQYKLSASSKLLWLSLRKPSWTEDMLGTPVLKRGRGPQATPTRF